MIRRWHRSRLFWIGIVLIPLLSAAWWASEFYPTVTTMLKHHRHQELGHRFGGWLAVWATALGVWQKWKRTKCA